ncbi:hypothetical protein Fleli_3248 [Bernardetia litoralis DSM 6794]|uniref:Uncharacterized protein n=1 Tax=Bernardetia litoralis (strain ATCC 23117 / DSM 6794 / NBRC 15988 / NCIMB 1366 / Fx l1 / Sio-4) TaxID=880071 RepID=I4ANP4_BERLS|nr:hypothetical protein [Bernardetia litoralis]AFM05579.1 hypothetical protein Fleli_3248 [Bernardetia litoralis DSM 6794]
MNTYILHSDLHKELLAQNRIDPITGDTIQEGDEVVFCAGCKSIFLKDTWNYLGKKHCNQSQTLKHIPSSFKEIKLGNDILFYQSIQDSGNTHFEISPQMEGWAYKENNTGRFHAYFYGEKEASVKVGIYAFMFFLLLILNIPLKNEILFILSLFLFILSYPIFRYFLTQKYIEKLDTNYKKINEHSFIIKPNGISICSPHGIKEIFLHANKLKAITLSYLGTFSSKEIVFEYDQEKSIRIKIASFFYEDDFLVFLKALARLSQGLDFPITLYMKDDEKIKMANQLIKEREAKFTIETRAEYLKKKYSYLYNYVEKIQKILPQ